MIRFEYANPRTEVEAIEMLGAHDGQTAVLAGGTDLIKLLNRDLVAPKRVVDIKNVDSMQGVVRDAEGIWIGTLTTLEELAGHPLLAGYRSLIDVIGEIKAIQVQSWGTIGGDLCHHPNCWYYRNGYGLLAQRDGESLVEAGDNRYHAIFGNHGLAKFVSASRFAPALMALGAKVRVIGPSPTEADIIPLDYFYVTPKSPMQGVTVLKPGQLVSHVWLPSRPGVFSATYEVVELEGLDWPLAAAATALVMDGGRVREAQIVLGHVAPIPWSVRDAAAELIGRPVTPEIAEHIADLAVERATPLSDNTFKVQLARTAVKRALLRATGQLEGGL